MTFTVVIVALVLWRLRRTHRMFMFRAIVDLGFARVCPRCGYDLARLPQGVARCPECGAAMEPLQS